jgi:hypothetical protein
LAGVPAAERLTRSIGAFFDARSGRRIYIQLDRPIYQPGDTIWIKTWHLSARDLDGDHDNKGLTFELVSPRGSVALRKMVREEGGKAHNDIVLPEGLRGGEYRLRVTTLDGHRAERPVLISSYEPPRIKKKLDFLRKAYGPGDEVTATIEVKRPTGETLGHHPLAAVVQVDGQALPRLALRTDGEGSALVRFRLPAEIQKGDGLLTVLVEDGGITESITRRIPILLNKVRVSLFPEGGELVAGLESRVYFRAVNLQDKPADIEGRVVDDAGRNVASFRSYFHGLGRVALTPQPDRRYHLEITRPVGITERFKLPAARRAGCVLATYDDPDSVVEAVVARVRCTQPRRVIVSAMFRERLIDAAAVRVPRGEPAVVYLKSSDEEVNRAQGVVRVTLFAADEDTSLAARRSFAEDLAPLAERLVYRNRENRLTVEIENDRESYAPRDEVKLRVRTTDMRGNPRRAELALSVVDDTVVSFADDKNGHMLSRIYLEPEIPFKVHEPRRYFDPKNEKAPRALDLLMGTAGYRRFVWRQVLTQPPPRARAIAHRRRWRRSEPPADRRAPMMAKQMPAAGMAEQRAMRLEREEQPAFARRRARPPALPARAPAPALPAATPPAPMQAQVAPPPPAPAPAGADEDRLALAPAEEAPARPMAMAPPDMDVEMEVMGRGRARRRWHRAREDRADRPAERRRWARFRGENGAGVAARREQPPAWAPARAFPAPAYRPDDRPGKRTDFRQTIHWAPRVRTGRDGRATVRFFLSDAVTSFRVFAEGVGSGLAGRSEQVFKSNLPFSMHVKLPVEISAGDRPELPLILTNETDRPLEVTVEAEVERPLRLSGRPGEMKLRLEPRKRRSLLYGLRVDGQVGAGAGKVSFAARAGGLSDEITRHVTVVPRGFPVERSLSGEVLGTVVHKVDLSDAVPGSATASVRLYPSPVATMVSGLEGMVREPVGCFEQASSANYPNTMVLQYVKEHRVEDAQLVKRSTQLLARGYDKLTGYESKDRGYEWFGANPGHEALTAYGLLQFIDMREVHEGVSEPMIARTAAWLRGRRDGKGGYLRNEKALDSFGRASKEVTDAYITYSLTEAGEQGLSREVSQQAQIARGTKDAYLLALATNTLLNVKHAGARAAVARLGAMQQTDGAWTDADHSITRSGGKNLQIETTSLAVLALIKAGGQHTRVRRGVRWLGENRGGFGQWGTTQATVQALRAMAAYARASRQTRHGGSIHVSVNGKRGGHIDYKAGHRDTLILDRLSPQLRTGSNRLQLVHTGKEALPYSVAVSYRVKVPPSSPRAVVGLTTALSQDRVKLGETVRLTARVQNRTSQGQPMTLVRLGFPGGLRFQSWQLKELRERGKIAFYETRPREVILYLRQMAPGESRVFHVDLVAELPGRYTAPASRAYLYYTDEHKTWVPPQSITVNR